MRTSHSLMCHANSDAYRSPIAGLFFCIALCTACKPNEPAQYTPSPQTEALTEGIEDQDELERFRALQAQIAQVLRERCGDPTLPTLLGEGVATSHRLPRGATLFAQYCVQCHGVNGDGQGVLAAHLKPRPRDYTQGIFKFAATSNGKPRRADLIATIRRGVPGTSMPSFATFSDDELADLADYVEALAQRGELERVLAQIAYDDEELPDDEEVDGVVAELLNPWRQANGSVVMPLSPMPPMTDETIAEGRELFLKFACSRCHGNDGRGGALGNVDVGADAWGDKVPAADLTSGMFHGGGRPIDLYRRIHAGIKGTPMPAFASQFQDQPEDIWKLVHFVKDLGQRRRRRQPPTLETPETATTEIAPTGVENAESAPRS